MQQPGREDVDVAIPESSGHNQAFAVKYSRSLRNFGCGARANGTYATVMHDDCAVLHWRLGGRGINPAADQREVRGSAQVASKHQPEQDDGQNESDSHSGNILSQHRDCFESRFRVANGRESVVLWSYEGEDFYHTIIGRLGKG